MGDVQIQVLWRTAQEHCEVVWSLCMGVRVHLWVNGRLLVDELVGDFEAALQRGLALRQERLA